MSHWNDGICRVCHRERRLCHRLCSRCRVRHRMRPCLDCASPCRPEATRCRRCANIASNRTRALVKIWRKPEHAQILEMYEEGLPISEIARRMGCTKNMISGYAWRQGWRRRRQYAGPITLDRLDALEARMNAVMADYAKQLAAGLIYRPATQLDEAA